MNVGGTAPGPAPVGTVARTSPDAGGLIADGGTVMVYLSDGSQGGDDRGGGGRGGGGGAAAGRELPFPLPHPPLTSAGPADVSRRAARRRSAGGRRHDLLGHDRNEVVVSPPVHGWRPSGRSAVGSWGCRGDGRRGLRAPPAGSRSGCRTCTASSHLPTRGSRRVSLPGCPGACPNPCPGRSSPRRPRRRSRRARLRDAWRRGHSRCDGSPCRCCHREPDAAGAAPCRTSTSCRGSTARPHGCTGWASWSPISWCPPGTTSPRWTPSRPRCEAQGPLLERPGVFVLGSNDYFAPAEEPGALPAALAADAPDPRRDRCRPTTWSRGSATAGWLDLTNRASQPHRRGPGSTSSAWTTRTSGATATRQLPGPPDPAAALTIGVTHAPYRRVLDAMSADGAQLLLAGHTHGGQLCLPGFGALVTNCDVPRGQAKGVSRWPVPRRETRAPGCTSPPASGRRRTRRPVRLPARGHPAHPHPSARSLTPVRAIGGN